MMTMSRSEALEMGAVTPSPALLETDTTSTSFEDIECSKVRMKLNRYTYK